MAQLSVHCKAGDAGVPGDRRAGAAQPFSPVPALK